MISAIQSYKINFNLNVANDINFRSFETLGAGSVLCTNDNPQYADLGFQDGVNCIFFRHTFDALPGPSMKRSVSGPESPQIWLCRS